MLQYDSFTKFGYSIVKDQANLNDKTLSPLQIMLFKELQHQSHLSSSPLKAKIFIEQMSSCYRK